jgi:hypothetical protein
VGWGRLRRLLAPTSGEKLPAPDPRLTARALTPTNSFIELFFRQICLLLKASSAFQEVRKSEK